ncbi:hypothetical protein C7H19_23415 [Aphanothece hegewaldii CCALA 016]|uniref:DUF4276 domain-containing protein n=1 Tax=Aphanothece hegewaldii CCALA 016 TaxID=2107694 RepID=A0A2T1LR89_9CHRO|nr:DUF4276 family protein [Aphanothece hegewaldii]PSF31077.1 hypothetical protein C7H19_23415 [Aphanothece hegewaldii CCALA 016]
MHIEFLVEEFSTQEFLLQILPTILKTDITYDIHAFRGKSDLLKKLPERLKGYKNWIPDDYRIIVLVDKDDEDCQDLKSKLEGMALDTGFITKSTAQTHQPYQILNRIAIEELEAWFFGDINAIVSAYPGVSPNLGQKEKYRDSDAIRGGTWENLEKVLQRAGHHKGGLEKVRAAREISQHMNLQMNRSRSFQVFYAGLLEIIS